MARGTFANVRLVNKLLPAGKVGPNTVHIPSQEVGSIFDVAARYMADGAPTVILAGAEYGSGSSRDWAAKGAASNKAAPAPSTPRVVPTTEALPKQAVDTYSAGD